MSPTKRRRLSIVGALTVIFGVAALMFGPALGAVTGPPPPFVTDYANYPLTPQAGLTPGCEQSAITGVSFSLNGGAAVGSLEELGALDVGAVKAGDIVTMTWTGVAAQCVGSPIAMVTKAAQGVDFDPSVIQPAVEPFEYATLAAGGGTLNFPMPGLTDGCFYQLDAIVGFPLGIIGPTGSFYNDVTRAGQGKNPLGGSMLISAGNGVYPTCTSTSSSSSSTSSSTSTSTSTTEPTTTVPEVTTTVPDVTTTVPTTSTMAPTTTSAPTTTTSAPTTSTTNPETITTAAESCASLGLVNVSRSSPNYRAALDADGDGVACELVTATPAASRTLAATGRTASPWFIAGVSAIVIGFILLLGLRIKREPTQ